MVSFMETREIAAVLVCFVGGIVGGSLLGKERTLTRTSAAPAAAAVAQAPGDAPTAAAIDALKEKTRTNPGSASSCS